MVLHHKACKSSDTVPLEVIYVFVQLSLSSRAVGGSKPHTLSRTNNYDKGNKKHH